MVPRFWASLCAAAVAAGAFCVTLTLCAEPPAGEANPPTDKAPAAAQPAGDSPPADETQRLSVEAARERAKLMHRIYTATLDVMHDRYFHDSRAVVPARAMEDVFAEMARQSSVEARWISVNTRAMSLNHEPQTDFEKEAAKAIGEGKEEYELVENGYYRRAGAIPLASGCVNCHAGFFKAPPKSPRFAGLVISVPVDEN